MPEKSNKTQKQAQPGKKKTAPKTGGSHQLGSQQGLGATHTKLSHVQREKSKAQKANTSSGERDIAPNKGVPTDELTTRVRDPSHSLCLLTTMSPENLRSVRAKKEPQILGTVGETVMAGGDIRIHEPPTTRRNKETPIGTGEATHGLKNSPGNLVSQAFEATARPAHPLGDRPGTYEEHQDINTDVLDTSYHSIHNNDLGTPTLETRPKHDVSQEDRPFGATKNAWHPTAKLIKSN